MKKFLLFLFLLFLSVLLRSQKESAANAPVQVSSIKETSNYTINIYPVPVRNNNFTIKTNKDISSVKVTNIIGQDIFRIKYNNPQQLIKVSLDSPDRGMYLVTIVFSDGVRIVKKIMIEESE